jgi:nicotinamide-nucleotide amidase
MEATIITIGDEILIGQIVDTNSAFIAEQLNVIGIGVKQIISVQDKQNEIIKALQQAGNESRLVLVTGGLGPTSDDITKPTICTFFETSLVEDESVLVHIQQMLGNRGIGMNEKNRLQAHVPVKARVVPNRTGTAPALWIDREETSYIFMPGVPFEMKTILLEELIPYFKRSFPLPIIIHHTLLTQGIPESWLSDRLQSFESEIPENIRLAYLPSPGLVKLRLTGKGSNRTEIEDAIKREIKKLENILGPAIYGSNDDRIEQVIGHLIKARGGFLATAESCTGGAIASAITSVPGSSAYFKGGIIAYSNELKTELLGVDPQLIEKFGAVSQEVVSSMATGVRKLMGTDFAIASSGIAGPDGGTNEKPVGTVWLAVAGPNKLVSEKYQFGDDRGRNIIRSVHTGLNMLRLYLR